MAKHVGIKLPEDLVEVLKKGEMVAVLSTFSEKGLPHTTPIQIMYPKDRESILISINKDHTGYHNMVWQKKVMLCFLASNNIAYSILGRAGVVRAPSEIHPLMNVVRIDIIEIRDNSSYFVKVESGVKWKYASEEAREVLDSLLTELKLLSKSL